ncbi:DUF6705 family protein [Epilithonimonas hispanica]|nr:DUF6705 family protein [Epilithonimonas hispanica]
MKNIILFLVFAISMSCNAQTYPLRTYIDMPENAYLKDTNNELPTYEGTWFGSWNNKTIYITLKKVTNKYNSILKYYEDLLIGKFKVINNTGAVLFDNTSISDDKAKIEGGSFKKSDGKYLFSYLDMDLCARNGYGTIQFTDTTKTKLEWKFSEGEVMIDTDCFYYGQTWPEPLPKSIILTKQ